MATATLGAARERVGSLRRHERGLTLVELLIVIALIAVLTGAVMMGPGMLQS